MHLITLEKLGVYIKFHGEYDLLFEKGVKESERKGITGEEFGFIHQLVSNITMINTNKYSKEMVALMEKENEQCRKFMTDDVYNKILEYDWSNI
ncbi:hypothetical protein [Jejuia spongiicola]|uniref:Uncharacterized protein n=1 Tax=Jejuia spongiicola TaxID=2942207 RepID=A0ABT0QD59_9FLAO|nr:hypothetical protein [Jejuia spongiicola]MCL6294915.1 hypothetical protein [Jejuia spongiicola]